MARWTSPEMPTNLTNTTENIEAWRKGSIFCQLWSEAIVRLQFVDLCKPTAADRQVAFEFFYENMQFGPFRLAAIAVSAWCLADRKKKKPDRWDNFFHCRQAYEIKTFFNVHESGKLQPQIGQAGWQINAFADLRLTFTESELRYYGFTKVPVLEIAPDDLWEYDPSAADYYRNRNLVPPPEVAAASLLDHDADDPSDPE